MTEIEHSIDTTPALTDARAGVFQSSLSECALGAHRHNNILEGVVIGHRHKHGTSVALQSKLYFFTTQVIQYVLQVKKVETDLDIDPVVVNIQHVFSFFLIGVRALHGQRIGRQRPFDAA